MDKFKINWVEKNKKEEVTSVTGFQYQIDSWEREYRKLNPGCQIVSKTKINNTDGTLTVSFVKTPINK